MTTSNLFSEQIKEYAATLGFVDCGIAQPFFSTELNSRLETWAEKGHHASMNYMLQNINIRSNPALLLSNLKSIVVVLVNYNFGQPDSKSNFKIAQFAQGNDYHYVIRDRLSKILNFIKQKYPNSEGLASVDTLPVAERFWAVRAGLGFVGQNNMLIHPVYGSLVLIGTLMLDVELKYDKPHTGNCMQCGACIANCPNNALSPYELNAQKCVSYLTIEHRKNFENQAAVELKNQIFGCDICNSVCPHNKQTPLSADAQLQPNPLLLNMSDNDWQTLSSNQLKKLFSKSTLKRAGVKLIRRNIKQCERLPDMRL